jgi:hypothetical protein
MENTNPTTTEDEPKLVTCYNECECMSHVLQTMVWTDEASSVDIGILTSGNTPMLTRFKEACRHICGGELNHTGVVLNRQEAWKLVDFLQREFLPLGGFLARTDGQTLETYTSKALDKLPDEESGHTYWGFTPEYIREPDYEDDPTRWFNTLKEAQEFRGNHNLLAKMVEDDLKILGLPLNDHELTRRHRTPDYMELKDTWEHATLTIAKKLSIVPPDYDRVASRASQEMPRHVGSEFRSRHVNLTVDGVRELL